MNRVDRPDVDVLRAAMLRWLDEHDERGVLMTDLELRVQGWNMWLARATGLTAGEAMGQPLFDLFPSLVERGIDQYFAKALAGEVKILSHSLHRFILPTRAEEPGVNQMPQRGQVGPLLDGSRIVGTLTIIEDVTERVATERELRARIAASEHARLTAERASRVKDEFLATLSHEIRTPLNAVLGWTRILRSREYDRATVQRAVDVIDRNASAQLTLISDMLDMARIATGKVRLDMRELDLVALASEALDGVRPAADAKGVQLVANLTTDAQAVKGDRDRLLQVIWNLLSNAVKFTEPQGLVTLSVDRADHVVSLSVTDTGQGIDPEFLPQVFERFKQADSSSARRHGGLGLGLALVRELVELHGGRVTARSGGLNRGSTFEVILPAAGTTMRRAPANGPVMPGLALDQVRVLIVEDDPDAREILERAVADAGASVVAVGSVREAFAALRQASELPAVVLTDIGLPGEDGYALLRELRRLPPDEGGAIPVMAVTAYATSEDRKRALDAGFAAHVGKPFAPVTLISAIVRARQAEAPPA